MDTKKMIDVGGGFEIEDRENEILHEVSLRNATWEGIDIRQCNIEGMQIDGFSIKELRDKARGSKSDSGER